jgi:Dolichyl-phosphate-mannose-protein mannosyltransferase
MPSVVPNARAPDRSLALALAVTCFLGFALFHRGLLSSTDEVGVYETARAIFERGGLDVPEGLHTFPGRDGRTYSHFAIGQSLLALPFYGIGRLADATLPFRVRQSLAGPRVAQGAIVYGGSVEIFAVALYGPVASALLVALFFLFERRLGASPRAAIAAALVLAGATYVGALSPYFLQHTTEALAILASLYFLFGFRRDGHLRDLALGSACAAVTVLIRVPAAVAGPALAGYALFAIGERARVGAPLAPMLAAFAAPAAALAALHAGVNHAKWGTWIASPFLAQTGVLGSPFSIGLVGLLVSPGAGLFAYSPPTLLAPWLLADLFRRHRAETVALVAIVLSFVLLGGSFPAWTGLWSAPGPRYLFVATPLLLLPLGPWLDSHPKRGAVVVVALAAVGAVVQLALLLADWSAVIATNHYLAWSPPKGFVWSFTAGPIPASARAVADGWLGPWLWTIAKGWEGRPGTPGVALVLLAIWAAAFGLAVAWLRRTIAVSPCRPR